MKLVQLGEHLVIDLEAVSRALRTAEGVTLHMKDGSGPVVVVGKAAQELWEMLSATAYLVTSENPFLQVK